MARGSTETIDWFDRRTKKEYLQFIGRHKEKDSSGVDEVTVIVNKDFIGELVVRMMDGAERTFAFNWSVAKLIAAQSLAVWLAKLLHGDKDHGDFVRPIKAVISKVDEDTKAVIPADSRMRPRTESVDDD
jgi:hypothetical protein